MFRAVFLQQHQQHTAVLQRHPADMHALGSSAMVARGAATRRCFYGFTDILKDQAKRFQPTDKPTTASVNAMGTPRSYRLPAGQDTFSLQMQQLRTVHALDGRESDEQSMGEYYEADDADLAAFGGSTAAAAMPSNDTAYGRRRARGDTSYDQRSNNAPSAATAGPA